MGIDQGLAAIIAAFAGIISGFFSAYLTYRYQNKQNLRAFKALELDNSINNVYAPLFNLNEVIKSQGLAKDKMVHNNSARKNEIEAKFMNVFIYHRKKIQDILDIYRHLASEKDVEIISGYEIFSRDYLLQEHFPELYIGIRHDDVVFNKTISDSLKELQKKRLLLHD